MGFQKVDKYPNLFLNTESGIYYWRESIAGVPYTLSTKEKTIGRAVTAMKDLRARAAGGEVLGSSGNFEQAFDYALTIKQGKAIKTYKEALAYDKRLRPWFKKYCPRLAQFEKDYEIIWEKYKKYRYEISLEKSKKAAKANPEKEVSKGSVWHDRRYLVYVLHRAEKKGLIKRHFEARDFSLNEPAEYHGRSLEKPECQKLIKFVSAVPRDHAHYDTAMVVKLGIFLGMRKQEITGLQLTEIQLELGEIHLDANRIKTRTERKTPIQIPDVLLEDVKYLIDRATEAKSSFLFPSKIGTLIDWSRPIEDIRKGLAYVCRGAGIEFTMKDLRATNASFQIASGLPYPTISKTLGMSIKMLNSIYDRMPSVMKDQVKVALNRLYDDD